MVIPLQIIKMFVIMYIQYLSFEIKSNNSYKFEFIKKQQLNKAALTPVSAARGSHRGS